MIVGQSDPVIVVGGKSQTFGVVILFKSDAVVIDSLFGVIQTFFYA